MSWRALRPELSMINSVTLERCILYSTLAEGNRKTHLTKPYNTHRTHMQKSRTLTAFISAQRVPWVLYQLYTCTCWYCVFHDMFIAMAELWPYSWSEATWSWGSPVQTGVSTQTAEEAPCTSSPAHWVTDSTGPHHCMLRECPQSQTLIVILQCNHLLCFYILVVCQTSLLTYKVAKPWCFNHITLVHMNYNKGFSP